MAKSVLASKSGAAEATAGTTATNKAVRISVSLIRLLLMFTVRLPPGEVTRFGFFETVDSP